LILFCFYDIILRFLKIKMKNLRFKPFQSKHSYGKFVYLAEVPNIESDVKKINYKDPEVRQEAYKNAAKKELGSLSEKIKTGIEGINIEEKITKDNFSLSHLLKGKGIDFKQKKLIYALLSQQNFIVDRFHEGDIVSIKDGEFKLTSKRLNKRFIKTEGFDANEFIDEKAETITISLIDKPAVGVKVEKKKEGLADDLFAGADIALKPLVEANNVESFIGTNSRDRRDILNEGY